MGFSVLRIWPIFVSVFLVFAVENCGFSVLVSLAFCGFAGFSKLVFGFRFLSTMMAVFRFFLSNALFGFSGVDKEITP